MLLYNGNDACVKWSHNMTSKMARHIKLHENSIREWVQDKTLNVVHVAGKVNPTNIFTKEMTDVAHFRRLRDSFMIHLSDFMNGSLLHLYHAHQQSPQVTPAAALVSIASGCTSYMAALTSNSFCRTLSNVSHFAMLVGIFFGSIITWFLPVFFSRASPHHRRPLPFSLPSLSLPAASLDTF
jgi:hypothetical protein